MKKQKRILVFEDDALFYDTDTFVFKLNFYIKSNINCDVIDIGTEKGVNLYPKMLEKEFKKITNSYLYGTYGYVFNLKNIDNYIKQIDTYNVPIDMILMNCKSDVIYKDALVKVNPYIKSTIIR